MHGAAWGSAWGPSKKITREEKTGTRHRLLFAENTNNPLALAATACHRSTPTEKFPLTAQISTDCSAHVLAEPGPVLCGSLGSERETPVHGAAWGRMGPHGAAWGSAWGSSKATNQARGTGCYLLRWRWAKQQPTGTGTDCLPSAPSQTVATASLAAPSPSSPPRDKI